MAGAAETRLWTHDAAPGQGQQSPAYSSVEALKALEAASGFLAAMTGAQTDRMTRDDGWRLLSIGRLIERLSTLATALKRGFETGAIFDEGGFSAMLALFDSTITFNAQYQQRRDTAALLDLLVMDCDNPRSLGWVMQTLRGRLAKLAGCAPGELPEIAHSLPNPERWVLAELCESLDAADSHKDPERDYEELHELLQVCCQSALDLSDLLSRRYFSHADSASHSLGA